MAWLSGLADKAENLLNKIDQNTASVLHKENQRASPRHSTKLDVGFEYPMAKEDPNSDSLSIDVVVHPKSGDTDNDSILDVVPPISESTDVIILRDNVRRLEIEKLQLSKESMDLSSSLERVRLDLTATRSELDRHKARALKTLQEKEKLILELKSNSNEDTDDVMGMEIDQLRRERDALREENVQLDRQLRSAREESNDADRKLERLRQTSADANIQAQDILDTEKRRRLEAEEDLKLHAEKSRTLKDELILQRNSFTLQSQKQNTEIARLRAQLSALATPSGEVESRLAVLTQTLVAKQQAVENLTTERNALRLQLEKLELEYRNAKGNPRRNILRNGINDTDDAKAQIPRFLIETPFDTGVARKVKRAYSLLDAIGVRTGVFLRRYPLARLLAIIYMAFLQLWVFVVLFSQSPEAR